MNDGDTTLSLILFSGTDDRLGAAAILATGAAAMGRPVNVFLQYWALDAFRKGKVADDHGVAAEAGSHGAALVRDGQAGDRHWSALLRQAKDIGDVKIHACALSMELFEITKDDLDPLVDDVEGVAAFMSDASAGPITFI
ncbi:MAG TPA: DsrE/DsrF/DrsH-like family protein [Candidatus Limnocylindria bacterium]|nr:DsrE/DsrF/DrsH-like family protein [Candidatus Limnocylindria bacterium]